MTDYIKIRNRKTGEIKEIPRDRYVDSSQSTMVGDVGRALLSAGNSALFSLGDNAVGLFNEDAAQSMRDQIDQYRNEHPYASFVTDAAAALGTGGLITKGVIKAGSLLPRAYRAIKPVVEGTSLGSQVTRGVLGSTASTYGEADNLEGFVENAPLALGISGALPMVARGVTGARNMRLPRDIPEEQVDYAIKSLNRSGVSPEDLLKAAQRVSRANQLGKPVNVIEALQGDIGFAGPLRSSPLLEDFRQISKASESSRKKVVDHYKEKIGNHLQKRITKDMERVYDTEAVLDKFSDAFDDTSFISKNIMDAADKAAKLELSPVYKKAFQSAPELADEAVSEIQRFKNLAPELKAAFEEVDKYFKAQGLDSLIDPKSTEYVHNVNSELKRILRDIEGGKREKRTSTKTLKFIKDQIQSFMPDDVKDVDKVYAEITSKTSVRKELQKKISEIRDEGYASIPAKLMGNEDSRQQIADVVSPEVYKDIADAIGFENLMQKTGANLEGGSQTAQNLMSQSRIADVASKIPFVKNYSDLLNPDMSDMYTSLTGDLLKTGSEAEDQLMQYSREIARILNSQKQANRTTNFLERGFRGGSSER